MKVPAVPGRNHNGHRTDHMNGGADVCIRIHNLSTVRNRTPKIGQKTRYFKC